GFSLKQTRLATTRRGALRRLHEQCRIAARRSAPLWVAANLRCTYEQSVCQRTGHDGGAVSAVQFAGDRGGAGDAAGAPVAGTGSRFDDGCVFLPLRSLRRRVLRPVRPVRAAVGREDARVSERPGRPDLLVLRPDGKLRPRRHSRRQRRPRESAFGKIENDRSPLRDARAQRSMLRQRSTALLYAPTWLVAESVTSG